MQPQRRVSQRSTLPQTAPGAVFTAQSGRPGNQPYNNATPAQPIFAPQQRGGAVGNNPTIMAEQPSRTFKRSAGDFGLPSQKRSTGEAPGSYAPKQMAATAQLNRLAAMGGATNDGPVTGFANVQQAPPPMGTPVGANFSVPTKAPTGFGQSNPYENGRFAGSSAGGDLPISIGGGGPQASQPGGNPLLNVNIPLAISETDEDQNLFAPDRPAKYTYLLDKTASKLAPEELRGRILWQIVRPSQSVTPTQKRYGFTTGFMPGVQAVTLPVLNRMLALMSTRTTSPDDVPSLSVIASLYCCAGAVGGEEGHEFLTMLGGSRKSTNTQRVAAVSVKGHENVANEWGMLQFDQVVGYILKFVPREQILGSDTRIPGSYNVNTQDAREVTVVDPTVYESVVPQFIPWHDKNGRSPRPSLAELQSFDPYRRIVTGVFIPIGWFRQYNGSPGPDALFPMTPFSNSAANGAGQIRLDLDCV